MADADQPDNEIVIVQDCHKIFLLSETLTVIFQHMSVPDRCRAAQVCRAWSLAVDLPSLWRMAEVRLRADDVTSVLECLKRRRIRRINVLEPRREGGKGLIAAMVRAIPELSLLDLSRYGKVSAEILTESFQEQLSSLTFLNLTGCRHTNDRHCHLIVQTMPNLVWLDLTKCFQVTNTSLQHISCLRRLRRLRLSTCYHQNRITADGVARLLQPDSLPALEMLELATYSGLWSQRIMLHTSIGQPSIMKMVAKRVSARFKKNRDYLNWVQFCCNACDTLRSLDYFIDVSKANHQRLVQVAQGRNLDMCVRPYVNVESYVTHLPDEIKLKDWCLYSERLLI